MATTTRNGKGMALAAAGVAAGALIVHTTEAAGYPWQTVVGSWSRENRMSPRPASAPKPLGVRGWITSDAATALLKQAGLDLGELSARATSRATDEALKLPMSHWLNAFIQ